MSVIEGIGGADRDRTDDLLSAIQALSQTELQPHDGSLNDRAGTFIPAGWEGGL